jgi:hypothetical protein
MAILTYFSERGFHALGSKRLDSTMRQAYFELLSDLAEDVQRRMAEGLEKHVAELA